MSQRPARVLVFQGSGLIRKHHRQGPVETIAGGNTVNPQIGVNLPCARAVLHHHHVVAVREAAAHRPGVVDERGVASTEIKPLQAG